MLDTLIELGFGPERKCPTMSQLEEASGLRRQAIWNTLAGVSSPNLKRAEILARALGVSLLALSTALENAKRRNEKAAEVQAILNQTH